MKEWPQKELRTAEEWSQNVESVALEAKFDTPEHLAVNDFVTLLHLYGEFDSESKGEFAKVIGQTNLSPEDRNNLTLQKIALLEHTVKQNQARIPGYARAYTDIHSAFETMVLFAGGEAKKKFPEEQEKQKAYVRNIYNETMSNLNTVLYEKQVFHEPD